MPKIGQPPELPMPRDPGTVAVLATQMDAWWEALTPGQKMAVLMHYDPPPKGHPR